MKQEHIEMFNKFRKDFPDIEHQFDEIQSQFSDKIYEKVNYLFKNCDNFTYDNWQDMFFEYRDVSIMKLAMLKTGKCPDEIAENIIFDSPFLLSSKTPNFNYDDIDTAIVDEVLRYNLSKSTLYDIFKLEPSHFLFKTYHSQGKTVTSNMSQSSINAFCEFVVDNIHLFDCNSTISTFELEHLFEDLADKEFLLSLLDKMGQSPEYEKIRSFCINNQTLSLDNKEDVELMDELFDSANLRYISVYTPKTIDYIAKHVANIDDMYNNVDNSKEKVFILERMIKNGAMPESLELDLMMKLNSYKYLTTDLINLKSNIFDRTTSEAIAEQVITLPLKERRVVLERNPNLPEKVYKAIAEETFDKIHKINKSKSEKKVPDAWYGDIAICASHTSFRDKDYELLFSLKNISAPITLHVATSSKTPEKQLLKLIDKCTERIEAKQAEHDTMSLLDIAKFNLSHRQGLISTKDYESLYDFLKKIPSVLSGVSSIHKIQNHINYDTTNISEIISNKTKDEIDKFIKIVSSVLTTENPDNTPNLSRLLQKNIENIKTAIELEQNKVTVNDILSDDHSVNIEKLQQCDAITLASAFKTLKKIGNYADDFHFYSPLIIDFYLSIDSICEKYKAIETEIQRRNPLLTIEKDKENTNNNPTQIR